jgi:transcriptional regulatory protein LevR/transcriptional regulator with AAA-type ATPase domain
MKNFEIVYNYIKEKITLDLIIKNFKNDILIGIDAQEVEKTLNIIRNNASTILNDLLKNDKLIKINSRPVTFIPKDILLNLDIPDLEKKNNIFSPEKFKRILKTVTNYNEKKDPFTRLIGYNNSLLNQVEQAKTAIMYPPYGLHMLILGESGVGKTTFASAIYEYSKIHKNLNEKDFPFVSFNCSDYFNASQLLLSQLFGHVKGAFTGADVDKIGLVEKANNGILFLDEVHRLPPDGQEMLFYLMDKGEFCRLGETAKPRKSNVLIICATTENPDDTFLSTFLRRIPVTINLPSFRGKTIEEKFEVIESLFYQESVKLNMPIKLSSKVLKSLALYDFKGGNIGQLTSEIKLLCAKAFFQHLEDTKELNVNFKMLSTEIKDHIFRKKDIPHNAKVFLNMFTEDFIVEPSNSFNKGHYSYNLNNNNDIYDLINRKLEELKNRGLSKESIELEITREIETHFKNVVNKFNPNDLNIRNLYKVIPKEIVNVSSDLINYAQTKLNTKFNNKFFFGFTFHIHSLIKRIQEDKTIKNPNIAIIKRQYKDEFKVSSELVQMLNSKLGIHIPEDEKAFLSVLLANNKIDSTNHDFIGIVIVCHGDSTASSIASVANKLLGINHIKAIDMPLENKISETYEKVKQSVSYANKGKGVLILADMGSLLSFGEKIMNETGIIVKTIKNVSTLIALDTLRKVLYKEDSIDEIYNSLLIPELHKEVKTKQKKKTIVTVCITGQGAGLIAKDILMNFLTDSYLNSIDIITVNYNDIENNLIHITEKYDVIACIGSLKPNINVPYFPINRLLNKNFQSEFIKFLDASLTPVYENSNDNFENKSPYETSKEMLEQYVKYINPKIAIVVIKKFIEKLNLSYEDNNKDNLIDLLIHMGCMLDRCVHGDLIKFENLYEFKNQNIKDFINIKEACTILEKSYDISVSDDEICYIIKVINK